MDTVELVKKATGTIRNFLNYILYHKVCPEHEANITKARDVCDVAQVEIYKTVQFLPWAPGDFNVACSTLFGGMYHDSYSGDAEWLDSNDLDVGTFGMADDVARKVMRFTIAGAGNEEQATRFKELAETNRLRAMKMEDVSGFEITEITPPDEELRQFYDEYAPDLQRVGKVHARSWRDPATPEADLPPDEEQDTAVYGSEEFEFFVEESVLRYCFVGMKVEADVWALNCGVYYFDTVLSAKCSFYAPLWNDYMMEYKEPKALDGEEEETSGMIFGDQGQNGGEGDGESPDNDTEQNGKTTDRLPQPEQQQQTVTAEEKENETPAGINGQGQPVPANNEEAKQQQKFEAIAAAATSSAQTAGYDSPASDDEDDITKYL